MSDGEAQMDMVVGITSYGYVDGDFGLCSGYLPAFYTTVDYFLHWIEGIVDCHPKVRFDICPSLFRQARSVTNSRQEGRGSWRTGGSSTPGSRRQR